MATKRSLPLSGQSPPRLGLPTLMDRALASRYGTDYVHLAAFAIDVDRAFQALDGDDSLPFGWEVRLTEAYLLEWLDPTQVPRDQSLLEDTCRGILEARTRPPALGSQLGFAVYCAVARGLFPRALAAPFERWRKPPTDLAQEVARLARDPGLVPRLATRCLDLDLAPPLTRPVRDALTRLAAPPLTLA